MRTIEEELTDTLGEDWYTAVRRKLLALTRDVARLKLRRDADDRQILTQTEGMHDDS